MSSEGALEDEKTMKNNSISKNDYTGIDTKDGVSNDGNATLDPSGEPVMAENSSPPLNEVDMEDDGDESSVPSQINFEMTAQGIARDNDSGNGMDQNDSPQQSPLKQAPTRKPSKRQPWEGGSAGHSPHIEKTEEQSLSNISRYAVYVFVLAVFVAIAAIFFSPPEPVMEPDFNFVKIFEKGLGKLQLTFTNQSDRFWKILKNRGLAHLRKKLPPQPLVILLAAPPPAHDIVDCFAKELAKLLDPKHKSSLARIDGESEKTNPGDQAKKTMDNLLITKFMNGHRVAVVHHLELLPAQSPLLFYSYCDNENAPHKNVAYIFTVHLPTEPDSSLPTNEAEGMVEKYLSDIVWSSYDQDAVGALLSRITDTVVLMKKESGVEMSRCS